MKKCRNCAEEKPVEEFYRHPRMLDGHLNICRDCVRRRVRKHRQENDHVREYDRERSKKAERKEQRRKRGKLYNKEHRERRYAHGVVAQALKSGTIEKGPCHFCGTTEAVEGHHNDYSKPLDVVWLCRRCHRKLHAIVPEPYKDAA